MSQDTKMTESTKAVDPQRLNGVRLILRVVALALPKK